MRISRMVSSRRSPSNPRAMMSTSNGALPMPSSTSTAVTNASRVPTAPATRSASLRSPRASRLAYTGMNDADNAPSPNRFCSRFGMRNAAVNASATMLPLAPR